MLLKKRCSRQKQIDYTGRLVVVWYRKNVSVHTRASDKTQECIFHVEMVLEIILIFNFVSGCLMWLLDK